MYSWKISHDNMYVFYYFFCPQGSKWLLTFGSTYLCTTCNLMLPIIFYHTQHTLIFSTIHRFFEYKHVLEVLCNPAELFIFIAFHNHFTIFWSFKMTTELIWFNHISSAVVWTFLQLELEVNLLDWNVNEVENEKEKM